MEDVGVGSVVRVPFGPRRLLGVVVEVADASELPPERLAEPIEALEAGATPELVRLGLWVAREYCSTPSRGLQLVLPPGTGTGSGGRTTRAKTELRAEILPAGEAALDDGERLGSKQRAVLEALRAGEMSSGELATAIGSDRATLRRLEGRGLIATRSASVRRAPGRIRPPRRRRPSAAAPRAGGGGRCDGRRPRRRRRRPAQAAPPRRHRLGQDRGLPGRRRGGAGARPRRDRPRPRDRPRARRPSPASAPASATASRSSTRPSRRASATTSGGACAAARPASASAPAPPSSPPSATSA